MKTTSEFNEVTTGKIQHLYHLKNYTYFLYLKLRK